MKLSTRSRYGLRAVFDIAYHSGGLATQVKAIAQREEITPRYLEQIFQKLKRAGIVKSIRGPKGGYYLARKPDRISVSDVIRAMEESVAPVVCGGRRGRKCRREPVCVARLVWAEAAKRLYSYFDSVSVERMCQMAKAQGIEKRLDQRFMYFI